jgi:hypothetical protein
LPLFTVGLGTALYRLTRVQFPDPAYYGIFYPSRHHNGLYSVALFERARDAIAFTRWGVLGDQSVPELWSETARIVQRFGIAVL